MLRWHLVCILALSVSGLAPAQEFRSSISGVVLDPQGAAVPAAKVTAIQNETAARTATVSSTDGHYTLPLLRPGTYTVTAEAPGFKKYVQQGYLVDANERLQLDIKLELGGTTDTVTVTAEGSLLETATASTGQAISTQTIEDMPMNGRTALVLAQLSYGVMPASNPLFDRHRGGGFRSRPPAGQHSRRRESRSGAIRGNRGRQEASSRQREFIGSAISSDDSGLLATLDTQARIVSDAGSSKEQLLRAIDQIQYEGNAGVPIGEPCLPPPSPPLRRPGTECVGRPLWDTIFHIARSKLTGTQKRKAIVVFTDGYDLGSSVHGLSSAIEAAESAGITVYTVRYEAFCSPTDNERRLVPALGDHGMQEIAEATGGRAFKQPRHFDAVYRQIEEDLRSQFVLAFTPGSPGAHGTWHRLNVQIAPPRAQVRAPARYRVP